MSSIDGLTGEVPRKSLQTNILTIQCFVQGYAKWYFAHLLNIIQGGFESATVVYFTDIIIKEKF